MVDFEDSPSSADRSTTVLDNRKAKKFSNDLKFQNLLLETGKF